MPFKIESQPIILLGCNLTKYVQDLYIENYKTLLKEIEGDLDKWRNITCPWIKRLHNIKISILPKLIYRFNTIRIKIPAGFFVDIGKMILKFMWKCKGLTMAEGLWKRTKMKDFHHLPSKLIIKHQPKLETAQKSIKEWMDKLQWNATLL